MKRVKSIVTVEGFERSYVDINTVLKRKGITPGEGGSGQDGTSNLNLQYDENTGILYTTVNDEPVIIAHILNKMGVAAIASSDTLAANITLDPTIYHEVEDCDSLTIADVSDDTYDYSLCNFIGRFTANSDNVNITLPSGILPADSNPDTEAGHMYEYNIFDGVFSLIDVTTTQPTSSNSK